MQLATLCYIRKNNQTLMLHRVKKAGDMHAGKWNGLGGKFEAGESPETCAIREIKEECGLVVEDPQLKGFLTFPFFKHNVSWYVFVFLIDKFSGELKNCPEGNLAWIDNDKLLDLNLWAGDKIFIPYLDKPGVFSGSFVYEGEEILEHELIYYK